MGLVNKFLYLCGKMHRLIQKLLNLWLILRSILICLMIGKLHLLLNPKLQKQGVLGNAYFLTLSCNVYSLCTMHFQYVLDWLIPFFIIGVFTILQRSMLTMLVNHMSPLLMLSEICRSKKGISLLRMGTLITRYTKYMVYTI